MVVAVLAPPSITQGRYRWLQCWGAAVVWNRAKADAQTLESALSASFLFHGWFCMQVMP